MKHHTAKNLRKNLTEVSQVFRSTFPLEIVLNSIIAEWLTLCVQVLKVLWI